MTPLNHISISVISSMVNQPSNYTEPLPTYDEVTNPNAPPPSYSSVLNRMQRNTSQEVAESPQDIYQCLQTLMVIIIGAVGCSIVVGIVAAVPIGMIVVGFVYIDECPKQKFIPVFLIVAGIGGLVHQVLKFTSLPRKRVDDEVRNEERVKFNAKMRHLFNMSMIAWFIIGSVVVYKEYEPNFDSSLDMNNYCNQSLYLFTFWVISLVYICLGIGLFGACILGCISQCKNVDASEQGQ